MNNSDQAAVITVEVTEEEYQADLARGLAEDEVLQPGRHTFRRGAFLGRHGLTPEPRSTPAKVRVSIELDQDVLAFVKDHAAEANDAAVATQINALLRTVMAEAATTYAPPLSSQAESLLADGRFLDAVAQQVTKRIAAELTASSA